MSVDLKSNTNYVYLKNLEDEIVVPRTSLAAVDMTTANNIAVAGNTIYVVEANPLQITSGVGGSGAVSAAALEAALNFARTSVFNVDSQAYTRTGNISVNDADGVRTLEGVPASNKIGISFTGPLPGVSELPGYYLIVADVKSTTVGCTSIAVASTGSQIAVTGIDSSSVTPGSWTRVAFILDAHASAYAGAIKFEGTYETGTTSANLSYKNFYVVNVSDLSSVYRDEIAQVIGTNDAYLLRPGTGIKIADRTINTDPASTTDVVRGLSAYPVSAAGLTDALSVGKAVDVTSTPSANLGTLTYATDLKGTITWATSAAGTAKIGFYDSTHAFPKFAADLVYILMADVKNTSSAAISLTFGGTDFISTSGALMPNETRRIALLFTTATSAYFQFTAAATTTLQITKLREFEVTGCTDAARKYIAGLTDPDDFTKFYLVDYDEQNPWTYIIDMKDSPAVTLMAGLSYKLNAITGTHTITTDTCPVGYDGEDAHLQLFVGATGNVVFESPLNLIDPLVAGAAHNITVKFRDGQANAYVDDTDIGYVVTVNAGTESGSLYYALSANSDKYVVFANSTDGTAVDLGGVTASVVAKNVVGNGYDKTTVTGSGTFTSKTVFNNLSMDDVTVVGGVLTMGDVNIPAGATVNVSGGSIAVEKVSGSGGVVNFNGASAGFVFNNGESGYIEGLTLTGGSQTITRYPTGETVVSDCIISGNDTAYGAIGAYGVGANLVIKGCTVSDNAGIYGSFQGAYISGGLLTLSGGNVFEVDQNITFHATAGGSVALTGSNVCKADITGANGLVTISSGAILDLTDNTNPTPIAPGGGVKFDVGGATVYPSAGSAAAVTMSGGYFGAITNSGIFQYPNFASNGPIISDRTATIEMPATVGYDITISGCTVKSIPGNAGYIRMAQTKTTVFKDCDIDLMIYSPATANTSARIEFGGSNNLRKGFYNSTTSASFNNIYVSAGAILDMTGNNTATPLPSGGSVTFAPGGATIYPQAGSNSAYALGGMTVPQLGNTNVVNLGGTNVIVSSGGTAYASGCMFTSGGNSTIFGGAINVSGSLVLSDCALMSNTASRGGAIHLVGGTLQFFGGVASGNTGPAISRGVDVLCGGAMTISGATVGKVTCSTSNGILTIFGSNNVELVNAGAANDSGGVVISSGASITLTSSIAPGLGGIEVVGGTCTINGNAIPAGTYTSIDSTGTPT